MQEQFTDSARQALRLARQTSRACRHGYVGSEHLLLGLLKEPRGTAGVMLREAQVGPEETAGADGPADRGGRSVR